MFYFHFCTVSMSERRIISSCARQNDVNAHVILPGAHRPARHMRRTFDTCFTLSLIYHLYVLFVWISYQARSSNCIYNGNRIVKLWEFYRSHPSAGNKQSLHIVSFSALRMRSRPSAGHTTICIICLPSGLYNYVKLSTHGIVFVYITSAEDMNVLTTDYGINDYWCLSAWLHISVWQAKGPYYKFFSY